MEKKEIKNLYIIPALRNKQIKEKEEKERKDQEIEEISRKREENDRKDRNYEDFSSFSSLKNNSSSSENSLNSSFETFEINENNFTSCCLLILGFLSTLSDHSKEIILSPFYLNNGRSQWFRNNEMEAVLFVYSSNQKAISILQQNQLNSPLRVLLLSDYNENIGLKNEAEIGYNFSLFLSLTLFLYLSLITLSHSFNFFLFLFN